MTGGLFYSVVILCGAALGSFLDRYIRIFLQRKEIVYGMPLCIFICPLLYVWIFSAVTPGKEGILAALCVPVLLAIGIIDENSLQIPSKCCMFIGALGCIRLFLDWHDRGEYLAGLFSVSGIFLVLFFITGGRGIGGGDIKLMAAAGLLLGFKKTLLAFFVGTAAAAAVHPFLMKLAGRGRILAYGPYLVIGIFTAMVYGDKIINWYLSNYF